MRLNHGLFIFWCNVTSTIVKGRPPVFFFLKGGLLCNSKSKIPTFPHGFCKVLTNPMQSQLKTIQPQGWIPDLNWSIADTLGLSGLFGDFGELVAQSCHLGVGTWLLSWGLILWTHECIRLIRHLWVLCRLYIYIFIYIWHDKQKFFNEAVFATEWMGERPRTDKEEIVAAKKKSRSPRPNPIVSLPAKQFM